MLTIWTYDWVPGGDRGPSGFVRDLRLRWACEEAGFDYEVKSTPFEGRGAEHFAKQPFGQIPFLDDDGITVFESGACLLYLARKTEKLMPRDPSAEADVLQWTIAALNSIEMVSVPWWVIGGAKDPDNALTGWLSQRLQHLEVALESRDWIAAGRFTVADIIMVDVLRQARQLGASLPPKASAYVDRLCTRPAFKKAYEDQRAHFAAGDRARAKT